MSFSLQQQKQAIIISLLTRASKLITDSKDFKEEKEIVQNALEDNNYPNWPIIILNLKHLIDLIDLNSNRFKFNTCNQFKFSKTEKQEKGKITKEL